MIIKSNTSVYARAAFMRRNNIHKRWIVGNTAKCYTTTTIIFDMRLFYDVVE